MIFYCEENAGGILKEGQEVVYMFLLIWKKARVSRKVMEWAMRKENVYQK